MAGSSHKSNKKRRGSLLGCVHSSKKSAIDVEEAMMLDEPDRSPANFGDTPQNSSYLARMIEMAQQTIENNGENLCHLASLANLASDEQAANELIKLGIESKIGNHLLNKNFKIQEKVAGILRNSSASGGIDVCLSLIQNGIVPQVGMAVKDNVIQMQSFVNKREDENFKEVSCCLRQLISLLWNLCEASETAVAAFNGENIIISLLEAFHLAQNDKELLLSIVQCLCTVTDENDAATGMLMASQPSISGVVQLLDVYEGTMKDLLIASTASGILFNVFGKFEDNVRSEIMDKMLKVVMLALDKSCKDELKEISLISEQQNMIDDCLDLLTAKQVCLELLANLLCFEEEHETMQTSDEENDDSFYEQNNIDTTEFGEERSQFQIYLKDFLEKKKITEGIKNCITYIDIAELQSLKENDDTVSIHRALARVQKSALACFGNILGINTGYDVTFLENTWSTMIHTSSLKPDDDEEFWLEFTGCLRALAMAMMDKNCQEFLKNDSFELLQKWYHVAKNEQTKCNLLKIFGIAGKFFSQQEDKVPYLQKIAAILGQELDSGNTIIMITETLDTTFDAFGEDGICDNVLASSGLAKKLCHMPAVFKAKVKSMKSIGEPYRSLIHSTRVNLNRFISYKKLK